MIRLRLIGLALLLAVPLSGCDQVSDVLNKDKSNGKAVGASCRHSGRALEDCYQRNPKVQKSYIYAGWKEMNEYMQTKKLDVVRPPREGAEASDEEREHSSAKASAPASAASAVKAKPATGSAAAKTTDKH